MAGKNTANIGFEKQIWDAACVLWGHIPAADYRKLKNVLPKNYASPDLDKRVLGDVVDRIYLPIWTSLCFQLL